MSGAASKSTRGLVHTADHLVIGGGLAGSMLGLRLSAAGREVTILERERMAHHKVCGEFLSREAVEYLERCGIDLAALGAQTIRNVRLASKAFVVETALPFTALSVSRCVLDEALLARAAQQGCTVERGAFVENLAASESGWQAVLRDGAVWTAPHVFVASGKHDLRGLDREVGSHGDMVGFKLYWRLEPEQTAELREFMELFLFKGGYGGLSLVEGEAANLCLVVRRGVLRGHGGWTQLLASIQDQNRHIAKRLSGATPLWERPLAISSIPYGYLGGRPEGMWCIGDQAAVIPSFTGDGMSIALHSAALAAQMFIAGASAREFHLKLEEHLRRGIGVSTILSRTLVSSTGRAVAPAVLSVFPRALQLIARSTRIPDGALIRTSGVRSRSAHGALI